MTEKEQLQQRIEQIEAREKLFRDNPDIEAAEHLHTVTYCGNHADGCGWLYESWENPGLERNHQRARAQSLFQKVGQKAVLDVLRAMVS